MIQLVMLLVGLVAGAFGWWVTNLFLRPLQRIEELRDRAHEEVIFYDNISKDSPHDDRMVAHLAIRRIAAGLIAASESASGLIHCWIRWRRGWDLPQAGKALVAFSNLFDHEGEPHVQVVARDNLDQALRLPPRYPKEVVRKARSDLRMMPIDNRALDCTATQPMLTQMWPRFVAWCRDRPRWPT